MKRTAKIVGGILLLLALVAFLNGIFNGLGKASNPNAALAGSAREDFVKELIASCSDNVRQSGGQYSSDTVNAYCTCSANGAAEVTTLQEAENYKNGGSLSADYKTKITAAAASCKSKLQ